MTPEQIAREAFGVRGPLTRLPGERNLNFRVGAGHVLKLHPPGTDRPALEFETAALAHVADAGLPVPRPVGPPLADAVVGEEGGWTARMLTWLEGTTWASRGADAILPDELGRLVARVDLALAGFQHPHMERPLLWNLLSAGDHVDLLQHVADPALRAWADEVLGRFVAHVRPVLAEQPAQVIHNDANDHNVIVDSGGVPIGLIDFGDVVRAPRVCGLAVACAYAMLGRARPLVTAADVVTGYHTAVPLQAVELGLVWDLIRTRLAMSVCMASWQASLDPDNAYLRVSQDAIRALVGAIAAERRDLAEFRFRAACGYEADPSAPAVRRFLALAEGTEPLDGCAPVGPGGRHRDVGDDDSVHLGVEFAGSPGAPVRSPLAGRVRTSGTGTVVLEHRTSDGTAFLTRITGVQAGSETGAEVPRGAGLGTMTGGRLHLQLTTAAGAPARVDAEDAHIWDSLSPDPNLLLRRREGLAAPARGDAATIARRRQASLSGALSVAYRTPLHIVAGRGATLIAADGREYLDLVNNVCHVGHCHPRVVAAAQAQIATLNTNTRYLHEGIVAYAGRLAATMPDPLSVVFLVNSGSEANDLALRLARAHLGSRTTLVLDHAYHGHLSSLIEISPYKFAGPGGAGPAPHVRVCPLPDPYRGRHGADVAAYIGDVARTIDGPAAFIAESLPGVGGQIVLPDGYLAGAYSHVRAAGGVCVADEVQVGFGRVGEAFWGFELQGVVPDIVTVGKPIGNGHPLAAVVTTPEIARSFETGMEYFNTFGGNPVSCAVGQAVLDVVQDEGLQAHALREGRRLLDRLRELAARHSSIGQVRGRGLFVGVELVSDRERRTPDAALAAAVVEACRKAGVLVSTDGPDRNVLKLKPPLVVTAEDLDRFVRALDRALGRA